MKKQPSKEFEEVDKLFKLVVEKHGETRANDLVAREMVRIYNKRFDNEYIAIVKEQAINKVLYGSKETR